MKVQITWPSRNRLIPKSANVVWVSYQARQSDGSLGSATHIALLRPDTNNVGDETISYTDPNLSSLDPGAYVVTIESFSVSIPANRTIYDQRGVAVSGVSTELNVSAGQITPLNATLSSTLKYYKIENLDKFGASSKTYYVNRDGGTWQSSLSGTSETVTLDPQSLTAQINITPVDANGQTVLLDYAEGSNTKTPVTISGTGALELSPVTAGTLSPANLTVHPELASGQSTLTFKYTDGASSDLVSYTTSGVVSLGSSIAQDVSFTVSNAKTFGYSITFTEAPDSVTGAKAVYTSDILSPGTGNKASGKVSVVDHGRNFTPKITAYLKTTGGAWVPVWTKSFTATTFSSLGATYDSAWSSTASTSLVDAATAIPANSAEGSDNVFAFRRTGNVTIDRIAMKVASLTGGGTSTYYFNAADFVEGNLVSGTAKYVSAWKYTSNPPVAGKPDISATDVGDDLNITLQTVGAKKADNSGYDTQTLTAGKVHLIIKKNGGSGNGGIN